MELRCDAGHGVFEVVVKSESYYFNWILPIRQEAEADDTFSEGLLPPANGTGIFSWGSIRKQKPTLVLDLDLTIAYCKCLSSGKVEAGGYAVWGVAKRPGLEAFLKALSPLYEIIVFTAADQTYADAVLDMIDPSKEFVKHRRYGRHLRRPDFFKDISMLGRDLERVVVIDDVPAVHGDYVGNVIRIRPYVGEQADDKLEKLVPVLAALAQAKDVRIDIAKLNEKGSLDHIAK